VCSTRITNSNVNKTSSNGEHEMKGTPMPYIAMPVFGTNNDGEN
jgi:hypothetical protein